MLQRLFTEHPNSVNETYWEHMGMAASFSARLALAALVCLVHAALPFLFVKTGSRIIAGLHDTMVANRTRKAAQKADTSSVPKAALQAAD